MIKGGQKHSETTRISDNQKKRKENVEFYQKETSEARTLMMPSDQCSLAQPIRTRAFWMAFQSKPSSAAERRIMDEKSTVKKACRAEILREPASPKALPFPKRSVV